MMKKITIQISNENYLNLKKLCAFRELDSIDQFLSYMVENDLSYEEEDYLDLSDLERYELDYERNYLNRVGE